MDANRTELEKSWEAALSDEFKESQMAELGSFLNNQYGGEKRVFPPRSQVFAALNSTPFDNVRVVILGQDPYHGIGQAHGLCFSVCAGVRFPPSLRNILQEVSREFDREIPKVGDLSPWAQQGVLLLNRALTVEEGLPGSHLRKWQGFTDAIIKMLASKKQNLVFMAWGKEAEKTLERIDTSNHLILKSAHPSPLSCHRGFIGNDHFRRANQYLLEKGQKSINWVL